MVVWKGLVLAGLVSSSAILAASLAPAGAGSSDAAAAAFVQLAQNDTPAAAAAAETPASTEEAPVDGTPTADTAETAEGAVEGEEEEVAVFTDEFLNDPAHLESGKVVWETCAGCHGARAYPGKAPRLNPKKYTPDFVFDRVTHGYKKMPAWKDVFTKEERMDVVAYILSPNFTP